MTAHDTNPPIPQVWCLALPMVEERPFTTEEHVALRRQLMQAQLISLFGFLMTPVLLLAWMLSLTWLGDRQVVLLTIDVILGFLAILLCVMHSYRRLKYARIARRDLQRGRVQRFQGTLNAEEEWQLHDVARFLRKAGFAFVESGENCVELYAGTGRLLRVNGKAYHGWDLLLHRSETAQTPEYASIAAQWLEKVGETNDGDDVYGGQRELTAAEIAELRRTRFRAWWHPLRWPLLAALWPVSLIVVAAINEKTLMGHVFWLLVIVLISFIPIKRGIAFARQTSAAANIGMVIILRIPAGMASETGAEHSEEPPQEETETFLEMLPGTNIAWTINGKPAPWRRL